MHRPTTIASYNSNNRNKNLLRKEGLDQASLENHAFSNKTISKDGKLSSLKSHKERSLIHFKPEFSYLKPICISPNTESRKRTTSEVLNKEIRREKGLNLAKIPVSCVLSEADEQSNDHEEALDDSGSSFGLLSMYGVKIIFSPDPSSRILQGEKVQDSCADFEVNWFNSDEMNEVKHDIDIKQTISTKFMRDINPKIGNKPIIWSSEPTIVKRNEASAPITEKKLGKSSHKSSNFKFISANNQNGMMK